MLVKKLLEAFRKIDIQYFILYVIFIVMCILIIFMYLNCDGSLNMTSLENGVNASGAILEVTKTYSENPSTLSEGLQMEDKIPEKVPSAVNNQDRLIGLALFVGSAVCFILCIKYLPEIQQNIVSFFSGDTSSDQVSIKISYEILPELVEMTRFIDEFSKSVLEQQSYLFTRHPSYNSAMMDLLYDCKVTAELYREAVTYLSTLPYVEEDFLQKKEFLEKVCLDMDLIKNIYLDSNIEGYERVLQMHLEKYYAFVDGKYVYVPHIGNLEPEPDVFRLRWHDLFTRYIEEIQINEVKFLGLDDVVKYVGPGFLEFYNNTHGPSSSSGR